MGLTTLGYFDQALKGLNWMVTNQNKDSSWYNLYRDEKPLELNKQSTTIYCCCCLAFLTLMILIISEIFEAVKKVFCLRFLFI